MPLHATASADSDVQVLRPKHSIIKQVNEHYLPHVHVPYLPEDAGSPNAQLNADGFGIAWYSLTLSQHDPLVITANTPMPCFYKSVMPPLHDPNLKSLANNLSSKCVFAHIRAATSGVSIQNNHPFVFGRYTFQHNGVIGRFADIKLALMGKLSAKTLAMVQGTTDSELAGALFFDLLIDGLGPSSHEIPDVPDDLQERLLNPDAEISNLRRAMQRTISTIMGLIEDVGGEQGGHSSLNFAVTDGEHLVCTRFGSPTGHEPPSLYYSLTEGAALDRRYEGEADHDGTAWSDTRRHKAKDKAQHIIVASEPCTFRSNRWLMMPRNSMLSYAFGTAHVEHPIAIEAAPDSAASRRHR